jgi:hypothetical protein
VKGVDYMCKWCDRKSLLPEKYPSHADNVYHDSYMMVMNYNRNVPELIVGSSHGLNFYFSINYCPICGKRLLTDKAKRDRKRHIKEGFSDLFGRSGK